MVWERARRGAVRPVLGGVLAAVAVLAGWQGLVLAFLIAAWAAVRVVRGRGDRVEVAFPAGALLGAALLVAWLLWSFGFTLRPLVEQFRFRTGQTTPLVSLGDLLTATGRYTAALYGVVGILGLAGLVLALCDRRTRALATLALGATLPCAMIFKSGAANHDYWDYWFLLPLALGLAVGADRLLAYWSARGRPLNVALLCVAVMGTVLVASAWSTPPGGRSTKGARLRGRRGPACRASRCGAGDGVAPRHGGAAGVLAGAGHRPPRRPRATVRLRVAGGLCAR